MRAPLFSLLQGVAFERATIKLGNYDVVSSRIKECDRDRDRKAKRDGRCNRRRRRGFKFRRGPNCPLQDVKVTDLEIWACLAFTHRYLRPERRILQIFMKVRSKSAANSCLNLFQRSKDEMASKDKKIFGELQITLANSTDTMDIPRDYRIEDPANEQLLEIRILLILSPAHSMHSMHSNEEKELVCLIQYFFC